MFPLMILWSGIMNIAKDSGVLDKMSNLFKPLFRIIFPEIPSNNPALGYIASNLTINMMGIHNASTPFGLKAMKCLQELNKNKKVATRSMITFLVLNTSGVTILATDIIAVRYAYGSINPTLILLSTFIVNILNTPIALLMDRFMYNLSRRKNGSD
jgi:spore maturation protein A